MAAKKTVPEILTLTAANGTELIVEDAAPGVYNESRLSVRVSTTGGDAVVILNEVDAKRLMSRIQKFLREAKTH